MSLSKLFQIHKTRKYPIKRDPEGRSLRARCFELFEQKKRPKEVSAELGVKRQTANRYFRDWRRHGPDFDQRYAFTRDLFKRTSPEREKNLELFAKSLGKTKGEFEAILSRPHGLHQLMTGRLYFPAKAEADHKMHMAIKLGLLISDYLIKKGGKYKDVYFALEHLLKQYHVYREDEDAEIHEQNRFILFMRQIMKADLEDEEKNQTKPYILTQEECDIINRWMVDAEIKDLKMWYWPRIYYLKAEGNSEEQAREKIYQNLLAKGNIKAAKLMRELQDKIHPLKYNRQTPPSSTANPSPPT